MHLQEYIINCGTLTNTVQQGARNYSTTGMVQAAMRNLRDRIEQSRINCEGHLTNGLFKT